MHPMGSISKYMSVLSDIEIKEALKNGYLEISGYDDIYIGPCSVDLHLDNKAMILDNKKFAHEEKMDFREREKSSNRSSVGPRSRWRLYRALLL